MYSKNLGKYKTAVEYYKDTPSTKVEYSNYNGPSKEYYEPIQQVIDDINSDDLEVSELETNYTEQNPDDVIKMKEETKNYPNTSDPSVWGPAFWFTLHNSSAKYPIKASRHHMQRTKGFILGLPMMLACPGCKPHAIAYIESHKHKLDEIVSGRDNLFKFFVDFHNKVNARYGKKEFTYQEAYNMYKKGVQLTKISYK